MKRLIEAVREAEKNHAAVGHFNISDIAALKAIFQAARNLRLPVIIGVSEGEREFLGVKAVSALVHSLRKEFDYPIFLNADHTHSLDGVKEAVEAEFDSVIFDGAKLSFEENVKQTREAVKYVKSKNKNILVEGELGYIGSSSKLLDSVPEGAGLAENLVSPEQALQFVKETEVDLFSPAVGNLHGMLKNSPNPKLNIDRIREIKKAVSVPLVLHGGSGIADEDFRNAIEAGISTIHINTEIRKAWREGIEQALQNDVNEVAPYRLLAPSVEQIQKIVEARLTLFNRLV
ncbi:MAG: class II fructose-bisphosphate aldolase [Candidatus Wildermuthbacteria bacterium]|nr:class II fructose-bisphosphate aldolase [Candidatus Wildermuthbacteria bacterium]